MSNIRFTAIALALLLTIPACSDQGDGRESSGDKREWSILQDVELLHRGQILRSPEFKSVDGYELLAIPNEKNSERIWVMLWPKSPPYYKQMPRGNYSISRASVDELVRSGRVSSTVEEVLRSHEENLAQQRHAADRQ